MIVLFLCINALIAQEDEFQLYTKLSLNPFDSITLEKNENHSPNNN